LIFDAFEVGFEGKELVLMAKNRKKIRKFA